jgi:hypothetical protein
VTSKAKSVLAFVLEHWRPFAAVCFLLAAFFAGRSSVPTRVETKTVERVVYQDRVVTKTVTVQGEAKVETRVVYRDRTTIQKPDGTVVHRDIERTEADTESSKVSSNSAEKVQETAVQREKAASKVQESASPQWRVNLLAGVEPLHLDRPQLFGPVALGLQVERRIIGPLWVGAFGLSSGVGGVSVGLEF